MVITIQRDESQLHKPFLLRPPLGRRSYRLSSGAAQRSGAQPCPQRNALTRGLKGGDIAGPGLVGTTTTPVCAQRALPKFAVVLSRAQTRRGASVEKAELVGDGDSEEGVQLSEDALARVLRVIDL